MTQEIHIPKQEVGGEPPFDIATGIELISTYFPDLTEVQKALFEKHATLFAEHNAKVNLVSRKDIENLFEHHILHSLSLAKVVNFMPGTTIIDVGTGGGLPGLPLAIVFPEVEFLLVDSIGKKVSAVKDMVDALGLANVETYTGRVESLPVQADFIVGRAVTDLQDFAYWVKGKISQKGFNSIPNGILYLKGGDMREELAPFGSRAQVQSVYDIFPRPYFETKSIVYIEWQGSI